MSRLRSLSAAAALAAFPAVTSATVINFDVDGFGAPIAANTPITNEYSALGVTFLGLEDGTPIDINAGPDPDLTAAPSAPNVLTNCSDAPSGCPGNRADVVRITFAAPVSGISLELDSLGNLSVTFNLYDAADNLLETQSVTSLDSIYVPVAFAATGVSRIDVVQPDDAWAWAMDNLTFTSGDTAAVPAPGALVLFGAGLASLAAMRRRA